MAVLRVGFDALGDHAHLQVARHGNDGGDNGAGVTVVRQVADKATVDLQGVDGELLQVGERRVAGAEVVQCDADACRTTNESSYCRDPSWANYALESIHRKGVEKRR